MLLIMIWVLRGIYCMSLPSLQTIDRCDMGLEWTRAAALELNGMIWMVINRRTETQHSPSHPPTNSPTHSAQPSKTPSPTPPNPSTSTPKPETPQPQKPNPQTPPTPPP